jgi:hypothetical protein
MENELQLAVHGHPQVENSPLENDIIEVVGGFFSGYGWGKTGNAIMLLDDSVEPSCGGT